MSLHIYKYPLKKISLAILPFLCSIMILAGCFVDRENDIIPDCKSGCSTISGKFTTGTGTTPLDNANLILYWNNTSYASLGTIRKKAITQTDANGYYELNFQIREEELEDGYFEVEIFVDEKEYVTCGPSNYSFDLDSLAKDTTIQVNYFIPRKAFIEVKLVNKEEIHENDHFATSFSWKVGIDGEQSCGPLVIWSRGSTSNNQVLDVSAEQPLIVTSHKIKEGVKTTSYDTLNLTVGDKVVYAAEF